MIDFFNSTCSEAAIKHVKFGLCDDQNSTKAYSNTVDESKWIAIVTNTEAISVQFTPIDHCMNIKKDGSKEDKSRCDGMLIFADSIFLVELKNERTGGWIPGGIAQLESTALAMQKNSELNNFRFKKAFLCNKKQRRFTVIEAEQNKRFFDLTGFRIDIRADIHIS